MNLRWSRLAPRAGALLLALLSGCRDRDGAPAARSADGPADPVQAEAELLGRDLADIMDRVMAYRSAHQGRLPTSLRQAGIDSLAPQFIRRLGRQGSEPLLTVVFRRTEGRTLHSCQGTSMVLEDAALHDGAFELTCSVVGGGERTFTVPPLPPPEVD